MSLKSMYWHLILHTPNRLMTRIVGKLTPHEALDTANAVLDVFAHDELATVLKVISLYGLNLLDEAFALSTEALLEYPRSITLNGLRGDMLLQKGQTDAALVAYDTVLAEQPDHAAALLHRASILTDMGHTDLALECCDKLISMSHDLVQTYVRKGNLLLQAHRTSDVQAFCDELLDSHSENPSVLSIAGALYYQIGRLHDSLDCYQRATQYGQLSAAMVEKIAGTITTIQDRIQSETSPSLGDTSSCSSTEGTLTG